MKQLNNGEAFFVGVVKSALFPLVDRVDPPGECPGCRSSSVPFAPVPNRELRRTVSKYGWAGANCCGIVIAPSVARSVGIADEDLVRIARGLAIFFPRVLLPPAEPPLAGGLCSVRPDIHALACPARRIKAGTIHPDAAVQTFETFGDVVCPIRTVVIGRGLADRFRAAKLAGLYLARADED